MKRLTGQIKITVQDWMAPLRTRLQPRRFQVYCIGTGKSGTHSMMGLFQRCYRARHEPESDLMIDVILGIADGAISDAEKSRFITTRDRRLWLEFESSFLHYFFVDTLVREFPRAKFILTIRDCYSWLDSLINQRLGRPAPEKWMAISQLRYEPDTFTYAPEEKIFVKYGLYPLESYLAGWARHNQIILTTVPKERLLVVRTSDIAQNIPEIADFSDIPVESLEPSQSHLFGAREKFGILAQIDREYLETQVERHCRDLMERFFPEIRSFRDAFDQKKQKPQ